MLSGGQLMVVLIVLIAVVGGIVKNKHRAERRRGGPEQVENAQLRDEVRQLKERIQVLERVITDDRSSIDLDREIERLRDR